MLERFRRHAAEKGLFPAGATVLVGYSGGADSTCLLHLLHRAQVPCVAAHLHHGQRDEADADLRACAAFAEGLGIPFASGKADVPALARDRKIGIEEAGREARYAFFEEAAARTGCALIATAHTLSDNAETVVLNLVRGTGLAGLAGIPPRREKIVRPLLAFSRAETEAYCREQGLPFLTDLTNEDLRYSRPRIRVRIVPELREINPAFEAAIERLSQTAREEDGFLDAAAAAGLERAEIPLNGELRFLTLDAEARFDRAILRHLPPVLLRRALRLVVEALGGSLDYGQTMAALDGLEREERGSVTSLEGAVVLTWTPDHLHVAKPEEGAFRHPLQAPGEVMSEEHGWRLAARLEDLPAEAPLRAAMEAYLDVDGFRGPLHFRNAQQGDRMRPLGGSGSRLLSDLLSESGLTSLARQRLPIICDMIGPIWAPMVALDERARPAQESHKALRLTFAPISFDPPNSETHHGAQTYANS
jgi:tRNA(Ile)-lysidine synthase